MRVVFLLAALALVVGVIYFLLLERSKTPKTQQAEQRTPTRINSPAMQIFSAGAFVREDAADVGVVVLRTGETVPLSVGVKASEFQNGQQVLVQAVKSHGVWEVAEIRPAPSPDAKRRESFFLRPYDQVSTWALACRLAQAPAEERWADAIADAKTELLRRNRSSDDLMEMITITNWALKIMNPSEPPSTVHNVVADSDDLEMAVARAAELHLESPERLSAITAAIERYR